MVDRQEIFFNDYHDRGMKKWAGFYLSEHTTAIEKSAALAQRHVPQKAQLTSADIQELLQEAILKSSKIALQKSEVDAEGRYQPDLTGNIQGYDSQGIYVAEEKIPYANIRHIELIAPQKWSHS